MKYLLFLSLFLQSCGQLDSSMVFECEKLANKTGFGYSFKDSACVLKKTVGNIYYAYYFNTIDKVEGAINAVDMLNEIKKAPLIAKCEKECFDKIPKKLDKEQNRYLTDKCVFSCNDKWGK